MKIQVTILVLLLLTVSAFAKQKIIVDATGRGDFKTIQAAINSVSGNGDVTIFIREGRYNEKLFLEKNQVTLEGESVEKTIITFSLARDEWRCSNMDDWGVATLNVRANDVTLRNITIENSFGFAFTGERMITCIRDTTNKQKTLTRTGHQMALRTMGCTRLRAIGCHFKAYGGDTVSPWEVDNGMWYFKDCIMEGGVDFYCPRGWAWAEGCTFITHSGTAAIWHDGSAHKESKTVLKNCFFTGYNGFLLGRYHKDAQFYLINCVFDSMMRDSAIYKVPSANVLSWGERVYYFDCHRKGNNQFTWYKNNLPLPISPADITVEWVFNNHWQPDKI